VLAAANISAIAGIHEAQEQIKDVFFGGGEELCLLFSICRIAINCRRDYPPGWQVIWEGWKELQAMVCGFDVMK
jgi:hypothetical protein